MNNFTTVLFDLDGTVTDPAEGITNSVAYALKSYGIEVSDEKSLCTFIGPPLYASFMKYYGFSEKQGLEAVDRYREYYSEKGVFECFLYDGIKELFADLHNSSKRVVIATSKPEHFSKMILKHFGLDPFVTFLAGATMDSHRVEKGDIIRFAFENLGITDTQGVVMIGDREFDVIGAKENGVKSIGVTYGYGSPAELEKAGADFLCDSVEKLRELLLDTPKKP